MIAHMALAQSIQARCVALPRRSWPVPSGEEIVKFGKTGFRAPEFLDASRCPWFWGLRRGRVGGLCPLPPARRGPHPTNSALHWSVIVIFRRPHPPAVKGEDTHTHTHDSIFSAHWHALDLKAKNPWPRCFGVVAVLFFQSLHPHTPGLAGPGSSDAVPPSIAPSHSLIVLAD